MQPMAWGTIAFLALLAPALPSAAERGADRLPISTVSLLSGEPVFAAAFSFMLLGEALSAAGMAPWSSAAS
ncbi:MAG: hypothetical protein ACLSVD_12025 [Eggerthellaceae bacterium]